MAPAHTPGDKPRDRIKPAMSHHLAGCKAVCQVLWGVQWEWLLHMPSDPNSFTCVPLGEKAPQMTPPGQVWTVTEGCTHVYVSVHMSACVHAHVSQYLCACVRICVSV